MMVNRVGTFFILLGLGLIGMFILSDVAHSLVCGYFIFGAILLGIGVFLWIQNPRPPAQPSGRFRVLKNRRGKEEQK